MSIIAKGRTALNKLLGKALDTTKPIDPVKLQSGIDRRDDGHIVAWVVYGEHSAEERLPRGMLKWTPERQSDHLDLVRDRLIAKLNLAPDDVPDERAMPTRRERRARGLKNPIPPSQRGKKVVS